MMMQVVGKKTIDKMGKTMNENSGSKISSFARRQMEKMGWTEGKGLGKNEDGMSEHIRQKKKDDTAGLGVSESTDFVVDTTVKGSAKTSITGGNDNWWHDAFASNLKSLNKKKDKKKQKRGGGAAGEASSTAQDDNEVEAPPTLEELFKATGGVRLGMRARADQSGKFRRGEKDVNVRGAGAGAGDGNPREGGSNEAKEQEEVDDGEEEEVKEEEEEGQRGRAKLDKKERKRLRKESKARENGDGEEGEGEKKKGKKDKAGKVKTNEKKKKDKRDRHED